MPCTWTASRVAPDVIGLQAHLPHVGDQFSVLLCADIHADSAHCDRKLLKIHLDLAKRRNAAIAFVGDTNDLMQGKWDPRANQKELRPEHRGNNYLDLVVDTTAELLSPYAPNIFVIGDGNHELAIKQRHQTCITTRLAEKLRQYGGTTFTAGIQFWVRVTIQVSKTQRKSFWICNHHGYGGGGEVTRGMIDNARTRGQYHADVYFSGHIHRVNMDKNAILVPKHNGEIEERTQYFLRGGSYKFDRKSTWGVSKGMAARPRGGWFVNFMYESQFGNTPQIRVKTEEP